MAEIRIGEDVLKHKAEGIIPEVKLKLRVEPDIMPENLTVKMNDAQLTDGVKTEDWIDYPVSTEYVRKGLNLISITLSPWCGISEPLVRDVLMRIRYGKQKSGDT